MFDYMSHIHAVKAFYNDPGNPTARRILGMPVAQRPVGKWTCKECRRLYKRGEHDEYCQCQVCH